MPRVGSAWRLSPATEPAQRARRRSRDEYRATSRSLAVTLLTLVGEVAAETFDCRVDHAVVPPSQERMPEPGCQPHRSLHHLDRPGRMHVRLSAVTVEREPLGAFEIAVNERGDEPLWHGLVEHDVEPH